MTRLIGRALTEAEYDTISKDELREAIGNSYSLFLLDIGDTFLDNRPTPAAEREFDAMSVEAVLEAMRQTQSTAAAFPRIVASKRVANDHQRPKQRPDELEEGAKLSGQDIRVVCDLWYTLEEEDECRCG